jgi:hypothetical protein
MMFMSMNGMTSMQNSRLDAVERTLESCQEANGYPRMTREVLLDLTHQIRVDQEHVCLYILPENDAYGRNDVRLATDMVNISAIIDAMVENQFTNFSNETNTTVAAHILHMQRIAAIDSNAFNRLQKRWQLYGRYNECVLVILWLLEHTNDLDATRSSALDLHTLKVVSEAYHKRVLARHPSLSELSQTVMDNVCRACLTVEMDQTIQPRQNVDDRISAYTTAMAKRVLMHYKQLEQENNTNLDAYRGDRYRTKYLQVITRPQDKRVFQAIQECDTLANKIQYLRVGQACYATNESLMHLRKQVEDENDSFYAIVTNFTHLPGHHQPAIKERCRIATHLAPNRHWPLEHD